jgi:hypothetical protein
MLNFNKIFAFIIATILLAGCMEQKLLFDFNQSFFKEIPGIGDSLYINYPVTKKATSLQIYISSFRERYIEKDGLLEFTELNDSSKIPSADYWSVNGYSQDLYIIKYEFTYTATSKKGKAIDVPVEAALFFSVKHNGLGYTIGVTPCYFGIINEEDNLIAFDTPLTFNKNKDNYYLKHEKKKKNLNGLLFMPANFPSNPKTPEEKFNIEKIVRLDPNKVGGYKPLVFDISKIFHDPNALEFHYINTIHLTQ